MIWVLVVWSAVIGRVWAAAAAAKINCSNIKERIAICAKKFLTKLKKFDGSATRRKFNKNIYLGLFNSGETIFMVFSDSKKLRLGLFNKDP